MQVHDTLEPLRGLRAARRTLIQTGRIIGDGGYSRVIALDAFRVLKLTSCPHTQRLLDALHKLKSHNHPLGLPAVLECWGWAAQDADAIRFKGYILERLFAPEATAERLRAKRLGLSQLQVRRPLTVTPFRLERADLDTLNEHLESARDRCLRQERTNHIEHLAMAEQLSLMHLPCGMARTFEYLLGFLHKTGAELDLFQRGNILVDCTGQPILADPVAEQTGDDSGLPNEPGGNAFALVVNSVVALKGLEAETCWDTTALSDDEQALNEARAELLEQPGAHLDVKVLPMGGDDHRRLLALGRQVVGIWSVPSSVRREVLQRR